MSEPQQIAIVGGGIGGLSLAYRLISRGIAPGQITLFEVSPRCGGLIRSTRRDGYLIEHGPDSIIRTKPAGIQLFNDLGLGDEVVGTEAQARTALIAKGERLHPVPEGLYLLAPGKLLPFALSPLLSWRGKLRAGLDLILPRRAADAPEESLAAFVRRRLGRELFERIAQPMAAGIYTADPELLSVAATMPQFVTWEREHRSLILAARARSKATPAAGPRYGLFATLRDGLGRCVERLHECCTGIVWRHDTAITGLSRSDAGWHLRWAGGDHVATQVAICGPAHLAGTLLRDIDADLAADCAAITYAGAVILNLAFRAEDLPALPQAAGFVVPSIEGRNILAATFMSVKYAGRAPQGHHLLRVFLGGAHDAGRLSASDSDLIAAACSDLRSLIGLRGDPLWTVVDRWPASMAQYHLGHGNRLARIRQREAALPGVALVGNGYEGVGIPDVIAQAEAACQRLLAG